MLNGFALCSGSRLASDYHDNRICALTCLLPQPKEPEPCIAPRVLCQHAHWHCVWHHCACTRTDICLYPTRFESTRGELRYTTMLAKHFLNNPFFPNRGLRPIRVLRENHGGDTQKHTHTQTVTGKAGQDPGGRSGHFIFTRVLPLKAKKAVAI